MEKNLHFSLSFEGSEIDNVILILQFFSLIRDNIIKEEILEGIKLIAMRDISINVKGTDPVLKTKKYNFSFKKLPIIEDYDYIRAFTLFTSGGFGISIGGNNAIKEHIALKKLELKLIITLEYDNVLLNIINDPQNDWFDQLYKKDKLYWDGKKLASISGYFIGTLLYILSTEFDDGKASSFFNARMGDMAINFDENKLSVERVLLEFTFMKLNLTTRRNYAKKVVEQMSTPTIEVSDMIASKFLKYFCQNFWEDINTIVKKLLKLMFSEDGSKIKFAQYNDSDRWLFCEAFGFIKTSDVEIVEHLAKIAKNKNNVDDVRTAALYAATIMLSNLDQVDRPHFHNTFKNLFDEIQNEEDIENALRLNFISSLPKFLLVYNLNSDAFISFEKIIIKYLNNLLNKDDTNIKVTVIRAITEIMVNNKSRNKQHLLKKINSLWLSTTDFYVRRQCALSLIDLICNDYSPINIQFNDFTKVRNLTNINNLNKLFNTPIGMIEASYKTLAPEEFKIDLSSLILTSICEQFDSIAKMQFFINNTYKKEKFYKDLVELIISHATLERKYTNDNYETDKINDVIERMLEIVTNHQLDDKYLIGKALNLRDEIIQQLKKRDKTAKCEHFLSAYSVLNEEINGRENFYDYDKILLNILSRTAQYLVDTSWDYLDEYLNLSNIIRSIGNSHSYNLLTNYKYYYNSKRLIKSLGTEQLNPHTSTDPEEALVKFTFLGITELFKKIGERRTISLCKSYIEKSNYTMRNLPLRMIGIINLGRDHAF